MPHDIVGVAKRNRPIPLAESTQVAASVDQAFARTCALQRLDSEVHCMAFSNATEIDEHTPCYAYVVIINNDNVGACPGVGRQMADTLAGEKASADQRTPHSHIEQPVCLGMKLKRKTQDPDGLDIEFDDLAR